MGGRDLFPLHLNVPQSFHSHGAHLFAYLSYPGGHHIVGQSHLEGATVMKDNEQAMHWFRQDPQQDHL